MRAEEVVVDSGLDLRPGDIVTGTGWPGSLYFVPDDHEIGPSHFSLLGRRCIVTCCYSTGDVDLISALGDRVTCRFMMWKMGEISFCDLQLKVLRRFP